MKKRFTILFIIAALLTSVIGCSSGASNSQSSSEDIRIAGSVLGGVFYAQSASLAGYINNQIEDVRATVEVTSGGHENAILIEGNNAMGISTALAIHEFTNGLGDFPKTAEDLTAMAWANPNPMQIVVREDSDIQSLSDLKGKVINPGAKGSGTESSIPALLAPLGMSYDDFGGIEYLSFSEAADGMRDGNVDAIFWLGGYPASSIEELATTVGIRLIPFSEDEIKSVEDEAPFYYETVIPGGVYAGLEEDIPTLAMGSIWLVNKNLSESVVYEITKLTSENIDQLAKGHNAFNTWEFNRKLESLVPLHPGAAKYYDEQGW